MYRCETSTIKKAEHQRIDGNCGVGEDPDAGKDWVQEKRVSEDEVLGGITDSVDTNLGKLREILRDREA